MGCNCKKDSVSLSLAKKLRKETKEKISEVKRLWRESSNGKIVSGKDELGFKIKE